MTPQEFLKNYSHYHAVKEDDAKRLADHINSKITESRVYVVKAQCMETYCLALYNASKYVIDDSDGINKI